MPGSVQIVMSANTIPRDDASLLFHRYVTEQIRVTAWFVSADRTAKCKIDGLVTSFTESDGMFISTEHPQLKPDSRLPAYLVLSYEAIAAATFQYSDDTTVPAALPVGSGLRINLPNGDRLTIMEVREKKE